VPILRANQLFRAVYVAEGQHEIRFHYRQRWLKVGLLISLATMLLLTALYAFAPRLPQGDGDASA
jgi:uncharacterized membrane protein YfhO